MKKRLTSETHFSEIAELIHQAKNKAVKSVNTILVDLYWQVGEQISSRVQSDNWGMGTVEQLAEYLTIKNPTLKGFSARNLWRMKQFYEEYCEFPKLSALLTELSWTNHLMIISKTKTIEEKEFYLRLAIKENLSSRELERHLDSAFFERTMLADKKLSAVMTELPKDISGVFKDTYVFEFLNLKDGHSENDLQKALVANLKEFILELGRDFTFLGEEYRVQIGMHDYYIDLLFYHRELQCLVAFELKIAEFSPSFLGQLNFYLEALDRDNKKAHENPSIGILLCATKDSDVVEYALSRTLSPALVADYETKLIDKKVLQQKLHELFHENRDLE